MTHLRRIYDGSLSLLTDLYQLTMAQGYWRSRTHEKEAIFHLFFRRNPFDGHHVISCGQRASVDWMRDFEFDRSDITYLRSMRGNNDRPLFDVSFLKYLRHMEFACDIDAMPEGTVVFPNQPMIRVRGPIIQCQLLETALLNLMNFQSLIATKASRIVRAAGRSPHQEGSGDPVLEFGLRRAQGMDGGLSASYAAYVGGCAGTSNVLAGKMFGIPVKGTHAHSWIMSFDDERAAFDAYAEAMPNNCVFLVDTYDTLEGVRNAIDVATRLRGRGHEAIGIRLDSGDLADLSIKAREMLDIAGFPDVKIVASNDLDEAAIVDLKERGARIDMWGIGTRLVTAHDQPALGGVYKLAAIRDGGRWQHKIKLSEQTIKTSIPGMLNVRRYRDGDRNVCDMIWDALLGIAEIPTMKSIVMPSRERTMESLSGEDLLVPMFRNGTHVGPESSIGESRERVNAQLRAFDIDLADARQQDHGEGYPVGLETDLYWHRTRMISEAMRR